jgi:hypothetical protein
MNKNIDNPVYVVYNPKPIVDFLGTGMFVTPSGLRLAAYPLASDEVKFIGSYFESNFIMTALLDYNPN